MSPVFGKQSSANEITVLAGKKLAELIGSATLEDIGLYNWGTKDKAEINRALVELVGCQKVDAADPAQSVLDPTRGKGGKIYRPEVWKPEGALDLGKTHTFTLKKRLPMPAVEITSLTSWFLPGTSTDCKIEYRLEGAVARADKTDLEVHVARFRDRQGKSQSSYYRIREDARDTTKPVGPDNPKERNEVPSGTDGPDDTHIWKVQAGSVTPAVVKTSWDGESKATKGVLDSSGGKAYINSSCAPYTVLLRYYKSTDDEKAALAFQESFCPRWKVESLNRWKLDPTSLVVRWIVKHGTKQKLVHGQIQVFDKDGNVVCRAALDKAAIDAGQLDLAPLWPATSIDRDAMPYRVQIQAHSGPDEPEGLALAIMPTQVRAYHYKKVQFHAFVIRPGGAYMGDPDHDVDITARCDAMIEAMEKAEAQSNRTADILKIFMAPEFYFRGTEGAYPVEKIETIVPKLRVESDKIKYADWMFVFGTAIGYEKHEKPGAGTEFAHMRPTHDIELSAVTATEVTVKPVSPATKMIEPSLTWRITQGPKQATITTVTEVTKYAEYRLTFGAGPTFTAARAKLEAPTFEVLELDISTPPNAKRIRVKTRVCARIPSTTVGGKRWKARQGMTSVEITASVPHALDEFWLTLATPQRFEVNKAVVLVEPVSTEVTNVALVQKGYPTPHMGDGNLRQASIFKEKISPIDFTNAATNWHNADASERKIKIHGATDRPVLPSSGSDDLAGASPNVRTEINNFGGGGVVFTMDHIAFGLEVCLDHGKDRLFKFYEGAQVRAGDPKVQVHLIPSWGISVGDGHICSPATTGTVFNVDGSRCDSVAYLNDGTWSCNDHPAETGVEWARCTKNRKYYFCGDCGTCVADAPGSCDVHTTTVLEEVWKCGAPTQGCNSGCTTPCLHAKGPLYKCWNCGARKRIGTACGCASPNRMAIRCENYYSPSDPDCDECGSTITVCNQLFQKLGRLLAPTGAGVPVPKSQGPKYFQRPGIVLAYNPQDISPPDIKT
jgi:hypothetical protein